LVSSIAMTSLSLKLSSLRELAIAQSPSFFTPVERQAVHLRLLSLTIRRLLAATAISVVSLVAGLFILWLAIRH
jgi:hypothetical protein